MTVCTWTTLVRHRVLAVLVGFFAGGSAFFPSRLASGEPPSPGETKQESAPTLLLGDRSLTGSFEILTREPGANAEKLTPELRDFLQQLGVGIVGEPAGAPVKVTFSDGHCGPGWINRAGKLEAVVYTERRPPRIGLGALPADLCLPDQYEPLASDRAFGFAAGSWTEFVGFELVTASVERRGKASLEVTYARVKAPNADGAAKNLLARLGVQRVGDSKTPVRLSVAGDKPRAGRVDTRGKVSVTAESWVSAKPAALPAATPVGWVRYEGETLCTGVRTGVSFEYDLSSSAVRGFEVEHTCRTPPEGSTPKASWTATDSRPAPKGSFKVEDAATKIFGGTTVVFGDAFSAAVRVTGKQATGTLNEHVKLVCAKAKEVPNCRSFTARPVP